MAADLAHLLLAHECKLLGRGAALVAHFGQLPVPMQLEAMCFACPAQRELNQKDFQMPA